MLFRSLDDIAAHDTKRKHLNHTPEPTDDCVTHGVDYLDAAYAAEGWESSMLSSLVEAHEAEMKRLLGSSDLQLLRAGRMVESFLRMASRRFFQEQYGEGDR